MLPTGSPVPASPPPVPDAVTAAGTAAVSRPADSRVVGVSCSPSIKGPQWNHFHLNNSRCSRNHGRERLDS